MRFLEGEINIGDIVNITLHPSGVRFNGPARVVAAYLSSTPGVGPIVQLVSLSDPNERSVPRLLTEVLCSRCSGYGQHDDGEGRVAICRCQP